jgi:hypothetical protein
MKRLKTALFIEVWAEKSEFIDLPEGVEQKSPQIQAFTRV